MSTNKSFSNETSERYSRALFEVASETNELEKIEENVEKFRSLYLSSNEIKNFLQNPTQNIDTQKKVIFVISEKLQFSKNLTNFFLLLIEKRRIFFVKKIIDNFFRFCSKKRGEMKASLISSKSLSQEEIEKLSKDLSNAIGSIVKFDYKVDEELIGGLKLQLGSFMIDTSIKNRLKKYKQSMLEE